MYTYISGEHPSPEIPFSSALIPGQPKTSIIRGTQISYLQGYGPLQFVFPSASLLRSRMGQRPTLKRSTQP